MIYHHKDPSLRTLLIQRALKAEGFYKGECDNWAGPRTEDALRAFQQKLELQEPAPTGSLRNLHRDINEAGMDLIKHFEGLFLNAYPDSVGVWTIGWGHTGLKHNDGTVRAGKTITQETADALFHYDMDQFEGRVEHFVKVPLNDNEFAALVAFDFNTGGLGDSTLLRMLNAGDRRGAADQFLRWDKAGGRTLAGLTRRRRSERNLFLSKTPYIIQ